MDSFTEDISQGGQELRDIATGSTHSIKIHIHWPMYRGLLLPL